MKLTSLLSFIFLVLPNFAYSAECPEGFESTSLELVNPYGQRRISFNCKNSERREFLYLSDAKKYVATVHQKLNQETGEEYFALNTLNIFNNDKLIEFHKFEENGEISRFEIYKDEKVVKKYISQAQQYQEFDYNEEINDSIVTRDCHYDAEEDKIVEEIHSSDLHTRFSLSILDANEKEIYTNFIFKISNKDHETLLIIEPTEQRPLLYLTSKYRPDVCINEALIPLTLSGIITTKTKIYTTDPKMGADHKLITKLIRDDKQEELHNYLASVSISIEEATPESENEEPSSPIIEESLPSDTVTALPPVEINETSTNSVPSTLTPSTPIESGSSSTPQ